MEDFGKSSLSELVGRVNVVSEWKTAVLILKTTELPANLDLTDVCPLIYLLLFFPHLVMLYCEKDKLVTQIILSHCFSVLCYSHFIKHSQSLRIVHHPTTDLAHRILRSPSKHLIRLHENCMQVDQSKTF